MLLQNGYRDAFTGVRFFGAGTTNGAYPYISNANSQTVGAQRNFFASDASILSTTSLPDGCRHPVAWMMPQKPGGLSTRNSITGSGSLAAAILAVKLAQADLTGNGELAAIGGLIVQLIADLEGDGTISSADVKAFLAAVASIGGSGGVTDADLEGLGALISAITGSGTAAGSTITATGQLDADLTVTGTGLSTANVGQAVWAEIIESGYSAEQIMRILAAVLAGQVSGAGSGVETFKGIDGTTNRVVSTVDNDGNRTSVVLDGS